MIRHFFFALLLLAAACNTADRYTSAVHYSSERVSYPGNVPERMSWLEGSWKSPVLTTPVIDVLLHEDSIQVLDAKGHIQPFTWHENELYYGVARQWKVTWVGKKDIRFDPVCTGAPAMTWTRQNDNEWILIEHLKGGDKLTFFTRNTLAGISFVATVDSCREAG